MAERTRQRGRSPTMDRLVLIIMEHILYADRYPERIAEIAERQSISTTAAMAIVIADQVLEEFTLAERAD